MKMGNKCKNNVRAKHLLQRLVRSLARLRGQIGDGTPLANVVGEVIDRAMKLGDVDDVALGQVVLLAQCVAKLCTVHLNPRVAHLLS